MVASYWPASGSKSVVVDVEVGQPLEQPGPAPEHAAGRELQLVGVEGHRQAGGEGLDDRLVAAPVLGPGDVAGGHDEPDAAVLGEQVDDPADLLGALEDAVEQGEPPAVAVDAVLALLGVDLGDRVVAGEQALVGQADQRRPVASLVRHHLDAGLRVPVHDAAGSRTPPMPSVIVTRRSNGWACAPAGRRCRPTAPGSARARRRGPSGRPSGRRTRSVGRRWAAEGVDVDRRAAAGWLGGSASTSGAKQPGGEHGLVLRIAVRSRRAARRALTLAVR